MSNNSTPPQAVVLDQLSNARRRHVIWILATVSEPLDVDTLAAFVVSTEAADISATVQWDYRRSVRNNLRNRHLEQLRDAKIVNWTDTVSPGPRFPLALQTLATSYVLPETSE